MQTRINLLLSLALLTAPAFGEPAQDAWPLYEKAASRISQGDKLGKTSPAASDLEYREFPPFSAAWERMAKAAYEYNAPALQAIHNANACDFASWPVKKQGQQVLLPYLSDLRNIANETGDAALYDHVHGREALALERVNDLLHVCDLLDKPKDELVVQGLVAVGIRALTMNRLMVITSEIRLTKDGEAMPDAVEVGQARKLIDRLFSDQTDPSARVDVLIKNEIAIGGKPLPPENRDRVVTTFKRIQMEQNLAAMSLACHLFFFEKSRWPASLDEVQQYLPAAPVDAWGTMGYVLVHNGTPDGKDRPLVYSRCDGDGHTLAYPTREPVYGFYTNSYLRLAKDAHSAGQFRDVTLWTPADPPQPEKLHELK